MFCNGVPAGTLASPSRCAVHFRGRAWERARSKRSSPSRVVITLHSVDENTNLGAISDGSGNFSFENLKPGHYTITARQGRFYRRDCQPVGIDRPPNLARGCQFGCGGSDADRGSGRNRCGREYRKRHAERFQGEQRHNSTADQLPKRVLQPAGGSGDLASVTRDSQGNFAVGGATSAQTGFSVDGISTASVRFNGALQDAYPSMENIAEMKVTAFNNNAEFAQIGDVTFVTKSGTNQLHGSGFEYFQDSGLDATVLNFSFKAPRTFNTFGGSLGGPVTIPKLYHGSDKTFFFVDYEGNRKTQSYPEQLLVPTAAERSGNLNGLVAGLGAGPVMNPFTGAPFPNNTIPTGSCQACINPVAQSLLNYYPLPNANLGVLNPSYNYQTLVPNPSNSNGFDLRLDHNITAKQQLYVRYSFKNAFYTEYNNAGTVLPANNFLPNDGANEKNRSLVVSYNYSITPTSAERISFRVHKLQRERHLPDLRGPGHFSARADLRSCGKPCLASQRGCFPDLQFLRRHGYLDRAGPGWTNHFGEHPIHRQSHSHHGQAYASIGNGCPQRALQRPDVLPPVRRLWQLHLQRFPDRATPSAIFCSACRTRHTSRSRARKWTHAPCNGVHTVKTPGR